MTARPWILVAIVLFACPLIVGAQRPPKPPKPGAEPANPAIAYAARVNNSGYYDLMLMDADGRNQVRLVRGGDNMTPSWSPDGEWIAFARSSVDAPGIYMIRPDGRDLCLVAPTSDAFYGAPTWSPGPDADGNLWIIYVDRLAGRARTDLFASRASCGATPSLLTDTPDDSEGWPAWSADGRLAANVDLAGSGDGNGDIHVFDVLHAVPSGLELVHVANLTSSGPLAGQAYGASWTPDGTELLVAGPGGDLLDLWVISLSEPGVATLLASSIDLQERRPTWSPDGTQIAFDAWGTDIYLAQIIRIGGTWTIGEPVLVLDGSSRRGFNHPAWRPVP